MTKLSKKKREEMIDELAEWLADGQKDAGISGMMDFLMDVYKNGERGLKDYSDKELIKIYKEMTFGE